MLIFEGFFYVHGFLIRIYFLQMKYWGTSRSEMNGTIRSDVDRKWQESGRKGCFGVGRRSNGFWKQDGTKISGFFFGFPKWYTWPWYLWNGFVLNMCVLEVRDLGRRHLANVRDLDRIGKLITGRRLKIRFWNWAVELKETHNLTFMNLK